MDDAQNVNTKDQSSVNDDLELSDDEMDRDSGSSNSSNSSNEVGCVLFVSNGNVLHSLRVGFHFVICCRIL